MNHPNLTPRERAKLATCLRYAEALAQQLCDQARERTGHEPERGDKRNYQLGILYGLAGIES